MVELSPSILVESAKEFERRLRLVDPYVKTIHIDILDGTIFPHVSWHDPQVVGDIDTPVKYELHLMVENPLPIVAEWKKHVKNLSRAIIQSELDRPVGLILEEIRQIHHLEAGVAINPESPIKANLGHDYHLDCALIMGVHPGASAQTFLGEPILDKIRALRQEHPSLSIGCDGGVNLQNMEVLVHSGCSRLVVASAIFDATDPQAATQILLERLKTL